MLALMAAGLLLIALLWATQSVLDIEFRRGIGDLLNEEPKRVGSVSRSGEQPAMHGETDDQRS